MDARGEDHHDFHHGAAVAAMISGPKLGICKNCQVRFATTAQWKEGDPGEKWARHGERMLAQLVAVLDEIIEEKREGRAVVTMSFTVIRTLFVGFHEAFCKSNPPTNPSPCVPGGREDNPDLSAVTDDLLKLLDEANTVLVCAAGNYNKVPFKYPAVFGNPAHNKGERNKHIPNLVVVGASTQATYKAGFSNYADWITTFAPGKAVYTPNVNTEEANDDAYIGAEGTSFGKWAKKRSFISAPKAGEQW